MTETGPNKDRQRLRPVRIKTDTEKDQSEKRPIGTGPKKDRVVPRPTSKKTGSFRGRPKTGLGPPMCNSNHNIKPTGLKEL